jgi:pimeloyl-ACP methyl ester carboxylesterase
VTAFLGPLFAALTLTMAAPVAAAPASPARFSVAVQGKGPDVIMIPGLMSGREVWDGSVAALEGKYRVHLVQIGGFAGEPTGGNAEGELLPAIVDDLRAYIASKKLSRPALVGHSMGGLLSLMLAERHPDSVGKVLIVDALPFYFVMFGSSITAASAEPQAAAFRDRFGAMSDEAFAAQQPATIATLARSEAARPLLLRHALTSDRQVAARAIYEVMTTDMRPTLATLKVPLTVAYAVNPFATEERIGSLYRNGYASAPGVRFVPVADSYHFLMLDRPSSFHALLKDFLAGR